MSVGKINSVRKWAKFANQALHKRGSTGGQTGKRGSTSLLIKESQIKTRIFTHYIGKNFKSLTMTSDRELIHG